MSDNVQPSPRLIDLLFTYHGGMSSAVYSVASRLNAGCTVARDDEKVAKAIEELRAHERWVNDKAGEEFDDLSSQLDEINELVSWLEEEQDLVAHRRCGGVDIFIECKEPSGPYRYSYDCLVQAEGRPGEVFKWKTRISEPAHSDVAVDSPEAYDRVAHAALSFATADIDDEEDRDQWPDDTARQVFGERLEWKEDGSGYLISRPDETVPV